MAVTAETRTGLIALSVTMLGSAPGTARLSAWVAHIDDGMTLQDIADRIAESGAFQSLYPSYLTNEEFASAFLGGSLGYEVSAELKAVAVELVTGLLNDGMTRGALALAVGGALHDIAAEGDTHPAYADLGAAAEAFVNKVAVAEHYTVGARMSDPSSDVLAGVTSDDATAAKAIHDIDSPPADAVFDEVGDLSIDENTAMGVVGSVSASDPNSTEDFPEDVSYSLKDAPDGFSIDAASGEISYDGAGLDHEAHPMVELTVVASSIGASGESADVEMAVTVNVNDVTESLAVFDEVAEGSLSVDENADGSETAISVGSVSATDADGDDVTYRLADGTREDFSIDASSGEISYSGTGLDHEEAATVDLTVIATSRGNGDEQTDVEMAVSVDVGNISEGEAVFGEVGELSLNEHADGSGEPGSGMNEPIGVGHVVATDPDGDTITYSVMGGEEGDWAILEDGKLCYIGDGIDFEMTESVDLTIVATSYGANGQTETSVEQPVTVQIVNQSDAVIDSADIGPLLEQADGSETAVSLGMVVASDADGDEVTYSLDGIATDSDNPAILHTGFAIDSATGEVTYSGPGIANATSGSVDLEVVATSIGDDGTDTAVSMSVSVEIQAFADAVFESADLAIFENAAGSMDDPINAGTVVFNDINGDHITYSLAEGTSEDWMFGDYGKLCYLGDAVDFETSPDPIALTVIATSKGADGTETSVEQEVMVTIHDVNDSAPSALSEAPDGEVSIHAMTPDADTETGLTFTVTDADATAGMYTATVYEGTGDDEAVSTRFKAVADEENPKMFNIVAIGGAELEVEGYDIKVVVTDGGMDEDGEPTSVEATYTVTVPDAPPPPRPDPGPSTNTFELTAGIDTFPGTSRNDLFIARTVDEGPDDNGRQIVGTITALDSINGGDGYDRFEIIYDDVVTIPETARVSNVEELKISTTGNVGGTDAAAFTGWGLEMIELGIISGNVNLDAGGAMVMGDEDLDGTVTIDNAASVALTKIGDMAVVITKTASVSLKGGGTITIDDAATDVSIEGGGTVAINSGVLSTLSLTKTNEAVTVTSTGDKVDLTVTVNEFGVFADPDADPAVTEDTGTLDLSGGDGDSAETVNFVVAGTSNVELTAAETEAINVSGSAMMQLAATATELESISVTGSAALTINVSANEALESLTSDSSGKQVWTVTAANDALESVTTGGGADSLTVAAGDALESISSGGGDDTLIITAGTELESIDSGAGADKVTVDGTHRGDGIAIDLGSGDDTYTADSVAGEDSRISGGSGTDTLKSDTAANILVVDSGDSIFSGFEILDITGATDETFGLEVIGINDVRIVGGTTSATLENVAANARFSVTGTGENTTATIAYELEDDDEDDDSITVNVTARGGMGDTVGDPAPADPVVDPVTSGEATLNLTANGVETVVVDSDTVAGGDQMASAYTNKVSVAGDAVESLEVTGNGRVNVTANQTLAATLTSVNTAGNTSGVTVNASVATGAVTFTGGAGNDGFTGGSGADTMNGGAGDDTLIGGGGRNIMNGGAGDDTITGGDDVDNITGGAGGDTLNGGTGADVYRYTRNSDSQVEFDEDGVASGYDTVTLDAGTDKIRLTVNLGVTQSDLSSNGLGILVKAAFVEADDPVNAEDDLMDYIGDGEDFFSDGVDDFALATGTIGSITGTILFIDVNGNGDFDASSDMVIVIEGDAPTIVDFSVI